MVTRAVWQSTITDERGNVVPGAEVRVQREAPGAPLAKIYADRAGTTLLANPATADETGFIRFFAAGGAYKITASAPGFSREWRYQPIGTAAETDAARVPVMSPSAWLFATAILDADPGVGFFRLNNANPALATAIYIDNLNSGGVDVTAWLDSIDDLGEGANRGVLSIFDVLNPTTVFRTYSVTGSVVNGTGYRKLTMTALSGAGSFIAGGEYAFTFAAVGATGTVEGTRIRLTSTANFYLSPDGSDETGIGSQGNPWKTLSKAYYTLLANYDFAGHSVIVHLADGTYSQGLTAFGKCIGQVSFHDLYFLGNEANPENVIVEKAGPPPTDYYCFAGAFGAQFKFSGMKLQQGPGAQDLVQAGSHAVVGVGKVIFGDSIHEWTDLIAYDGGIIYVLDNYTIHKSFVTETGTTTAGSPTITGVSDFTGIKLYQGIFAPSLVDTDTFVAGFDVGAGTVTMSKNAIGNGGGDIAYLNGGVCHVTAGRNGTIDYFTNGNPNARTVTIVDLCYYWQAFEFVNGGRIDMQAVKWVNPASVFAHPVITRANGVADNYREGVGGNYPPGNFVFLNPASFTAGDDTVTLGATTGVKRDQFVNGYVSISAALTNGNPVITVASLANIEGGCKVWGDGIPAGADVIGISGAGPYNLTLSHPCTLTGTRTVKITGGGIKNGTYVVKLVGSVITLSQPAISTQSGVQLAFGGLHESGGQLV
jgi:hypothetical protein